MLGEFLTRGLILLLGYAYPAFECYKVVEKNRVEIEELRFWCQYWILVAMLTVCERIGDIFISWLPMYGEAKLAFFIYLWYPKTKGTGYVYSTLLRPYVSKHETDIDRKILELRARAWDVGIYYWQNFAQLGSAKFLEILQYLAGQSAKMNNNSTQKSNQNGYNQPPEKQQSGKTQKWPTPQSPPPPSTIINRAVSEPTKPNPPQVHTRTPSEPSIPEEHSFPPSPSAPASPNDKLLQARLRLRRQN